MTVGQFTAKDVQRLRREAGVGMMDAKQALAECAGDFDRAKAYLREKGLSDAAKLSGRPANEGAIGVYLHQPAGYPTVGVLVELASETDFVAKSEEFQETARRIAMHIAASQPEWITTKEVPEAEIARERDIIAKQATNEGKPDDVIPRIVEGRLGSFLEDNVLYEQVYVNTEQFDGTIGDMVQQLAAKMGENIGVKRFARVAVGES